VKGRRSQEEKEQKAGDGCGFYYRSGKLGLLSDDLVTFGDPRERTGQDVRIEQPACKKPDGKLAG